MVKTAATMTSADVPEGRSPEEFLNNRDLVGFYRRELDAMDPADPARAEVVVRLKAALRALATIEADEIE